MKKAIVLFLILAGAVILLSGCAAPNDEPIAEFNISENQLQSICRLATLKCYFNNVAKTTMEGNFIQKDSEMWIEYSGTVNMGVDFSKVTLEADGDKLIITMPDAEVLNADDPQIDENAYFFSEKNIFSAKMTAEDERDAFTEAQENMMMPANESKTLLRAAKTRAQVLIENYVNQMDELAGTSHMIVWKAMG